MSSGSLFRNIRPLRSQAARASLRAPRVVTRNALTWWITCLRRLLLGCVFLGGRLRLGRRSRQGQHVRVVVEIEAGGCGALERGHRLEDLVADVLGDEADRAVGHEDVGAGL